MASYILCYYSYDLEVFHPQKHVILDEKGSVLLKNHLVN